MAEMVRWVDLGVAAVLVVVAVGAVLCAGRPRPLLVGAGVVGLVAVVVGYVSEGARWQLLALTGIGVVVALLGLWANGRTGARVLRLLATAAVVVVTVVVAAAAWVLPPAEVPAPTGTLPVGVASAVLVDPTRDAHGVAATDPAAVDAPRSLPVTVWYPATAPGPGGPLIADDTRATVDGLAGQYVLPSWVLAELARAEGPATPGATARPGDFPVVLFSPGLNSSRWLAASWATDLASRGAVVVAVDHPYDAAAVRLADGTLARDALVATGDAQEDAARAEDWTRTRATDLAAVLDRLSQQRDVLPGLGSADVDHVVVAGHSAGGAAALLLAATDPRVAGVVDVDGMPRSPAVDRGLPTVVLVAGDAGPNPRYDEATDALVAAGAERVTVDGVAHLGFTDVSAVVGPVPRLVGKRGSSGPRAAAAVTWAVVEAVERGTPVSVDALAEVGAVG